MKRSLTSRATRQGGHAHSLQQLALYSKGAWYLTRTVIIVLEEHVVESILTSRIESRSRSGPVAQLVEQGTENPCVGGSTPPWATTLSLFVSVRLLSSLLVVCLLGSGCGADSCENLCSWTTTRLRRCLTSWSATWEDLGAEDAASFREQCESDWAATRADLEAREVRLTIDECEDAFDELSSMDGCDELKTLYLPE